jgi:hypothetical protein
MSIDSKIAEIMEESKLAGLVLENEEEIVEELDEDFITEEEYDSLDEEEQALYELSKELTLEDYSVEELEDFMMSEEFEQLDELSKKTLGSYINKSSKQASDSAHKSSALGQPSNYYSSGNRSEHEKHSKIATKRSQGISKAVDRLTNKQSNKDKKNLGSYVKKAHNDMHSNIGYAADDKEYGMHDRAKTRLAKADNRSKNISKAVSKLTKEDVQVDVSADVDALMFGESLSEEFREKAATIFESAVVVRVKEEVARLEEEFEEKLAEQVDSITEGLVEKIDGYLDYVVEQWIEQNEIALENGLKSDIMESFITGMKGLFQEHYIDVPEEKYDVIGEMETKIDMLESKLNEQVERNIDLKKSLSESVRKEIVSMVSEGLTDTETEKFTALVEELSYDDEYSFKVKVQTIRENYFTGKQSTLVESVVTDSPVDELNENKYVNIDPTVAAYAKALQQYNN